MNPKPDACQGCPAYDWGVSFVPPENRGKPTRFAIMGQGPGEVEARSGRPFHPNAPSGKTLDFWLHAAGLSRSYTLLCNVVWCWLPAKKVRGEPQGNRTPTVKEIAFCRAAHWYRLLQEEGYLDPERLVVAIGAPASQALLGRPKVSKYQGSFEQVEI